MSRPERTARAESFYSHGEATRYEANARMAVQQRSLADRALQLLDLPPGIPALILDAGCGTGYSGRPLEKAGHRWIGTDISFPMLKSSNVAAARRGGGLTQVLCDDLGSGLPFRNGVFDGCVSISAVQWLCHATQPSHDPQKRIRKFFTALRAVLAAGARAVLQLYPEQPEDMEMLREAALNCGFSGGLVVDYPWSERAKKLFLVLIAPKREASLNARTWMGDLVTTKGGSSAAPSGGPDAGWRGNGSSKGQGKNRQKGKRKREGSS